MGKHRLPNSPGAQSSADDAARQWRVRASLVKNLENRPTAIQQQFQTQYAITRFVKGSVLRRRNSSLNAPVQRLPQAAPAPKPFGVTGNIEIRNFVQP